MTGREYREYRLNKGWSIRRAATEMGISPRLVQELERDRVTRPHPHNAKLIAEHFKVKVTDLFPEDDRPEPEAKRIAA